MLSITDKAKERVLEAIRGEGKSGLGLRVTIDGRAPSGLQYGLALVTPDEIQETDEMVDAGEFKIYLDAEAAPRMQEASLDFVETLSESGFKVENADESIHWDDPVSQKVQKVLDEKINPGGAGHGGWVELLGRKDDTVYLKLGGGCQGCGMVDVTLKQGIEVMLKEDVPEIHHVVDQTDHAGGTNPYYQPSKG
jgi:Fe/S biogenesis protein NfuA